MRYDNDDETLPGPKCSRLMTIWYRTLVNLHRVRNLDNNVELDTIDGQIEISWFKLKESSF